MILEVKIRIKKIPKNLITGTSSEEKNSGNRMNKVWIVLCEIVVITKKFNTLISYV